MIPARYAATRFPAKLMQLLGDKTVILHTYNNTVATGLFDEVMVVTDSEIIFNEITSHGGKAVMSKREHESGSDRIAEAIENLAVDIVVNVQGDEPFVQKEPLKNLLKAFDDKQVQVASLMKKITDFSLLHNPNYVKVVTDKNNNALYFSRSPIPFLRDEKLKPDYFEHIGVYAFQKKALMRFTKWPATKLEQFEKLEQLRYLENGIPIRMVETDTATVKIDVPEDLAVAEKHLQNF